uniref:Serine/threonine-protein phosphatase 7 long form homolog n=1 Tax=Nicotiana tabacum TaxID=4097 RepID=A0A1S3XH81_TOBAC|nr:PREDICTED: serine/threonine-protein phosphatase 7 long form homolog [Nicotiana tabacum]
MRGLPSYVAEAHRFPACRVDCVDGSSQLQLTPVRQNLVALHAEITDNSPPEDIGRQPRLLLLMMFGGILFLKTSGYLDSLRFLHHLERLDDLAGYSWGGVVLAYMYRKMCRACMGTHRDVADFIPLLHFQLPLPPIAPDAPPPPFLPLARRWVDRRGHTGEVEARHHLPYYMDLLDLLEGAQFIWRPCNNVLIAGLPDYCSRSRAMWSSSVPLICLDIVEYRATERVLRQIDRPQLRDDHRMVDQTYLAWLEAQIEDWDQRYVLIPPHPPPDRLEGEHEYMGWYRRVTQLLIGNPVHCASGRYIPYAGRHEALAIGLHQFYQLGLEMLQHTSDGVVVMHGFDHRVTDLAADTLRYAGEDGRLGYKASYVPPEEYHHGPPMALQRGRRGRRGQRGKGGPRGRGGQ